MHGAPWGTMDGWLRFEVDERAQRYGQVRRPGRDPHPPIDVPETDTSPTTPTPTLAREDVTTCA
jgi:hypothetical protein